MSLKPQNRIVMRTAAYSIAIGVPLTTAYVWLGITVARTWYVYDNEPFVVLFTCLICGIIGFALLGGFVGVIMTIVTKLAHGNIIYGARFRLLVSLIPLVIIALLLQPTPPETLERFWWKLQLGYPLAKLYAAGWLLAASAGVGVCQMVAAKYEREVSPPKNDSPTALWRPIPLVKMTATIVVFSVGLTVVSDVLFIALLENRSLSIGLDLENLMRFARDGVSIGLIFGSAIALTIMLRFSEIRRANGYRVTILGVTLVVALSLWGLQTYSALWATMQYPEESWRVILALAEAGLSSIAVVFMAEFYRRAATAPAQKRKVSENDLLIS